MNNSMKTPLIRLAKREGMDKRTVWAIRVGSILLALLLGALVIAISGVNPFKAYGTIITGALGKKTAIRQTVKIAVPLLGCALAIAPCFKMRFWNIGAEGQITAGAIAASYFALYWVGKVPSAVLLLIMGAAGAVAVGNDLKAVFISSPFPQAMQDIPYVGKILFGNSIFFYLGVVLAIVMHLFLNKSRTGLQLRSVGESPATADAAGINVSRYRYLGAIIGGGISAVGGMVYITTIAGCVWNHEGLSGVGWLAVALVIFCLWRPLSAIWGSVLFGALMILYLRLTIPFIPTQLYKILPYVVTLVVLIIVSLRKKREDQPPTSLGLNYFREDR